MSTPTITDLGQLDAACQRTEQLVQEAVEAERAAFRQVAGRLRRVRGGLRGGRSRTGELGAGTPLIAAPGRSGLETKAGRAPHSTHQFFRKEELS